MSNFAKRTKRASEEIAYDEDHKVVTNKEKFMSISPSDNIDWAAQQIIQHFTEKQFMELEACFAKLNEALYKSWASDMTFYELKSAVKLVSEEVDVW